MQNSPPLFLLFVALVGFIGVAAVIAGLRLQPARPSRGLILLAVLPALAMVGLFYSLAIHMHRSLGGWPASIGERGFSSPLIAHADLAGQYFGALVLISVSVWPVALGLCALVRSWRGALLYLGAYGLSCLVCFTAMLLAPSQFMYWWWD